MRPASREETGVAGSSPAGSARARPRGWPAAAARSASAAMIRRRVGSASSSIPRPLRFGMHRRCQPALHWRSTGAEHDRRSASAARRSNGGRARPVVSLGWKHLRETVTSSPAPRDDHFAWLEPLGRDGRLPLRRAVRFAPHAETVVSLGWNHRSQRRAFLRRPLIVPLDATIIGKVPSWARPSTADADRRASAAAATPRRRRDRPSRPSTVARSPARRPARRARATAASGIDDDVGALADGQAAAIGLAGGDGRDRGRRSGCARSSGSASCGPNGGVPAGQRGSSRLTARAIPGHGSNGSTGASVPNARTAPVAAIDAHV